MDSFRNSGPVCGVDVCMGSNPNRKARVRRTAILIAGCFVVAFVGTILLALVESYRNDQDESDVYSAYLSQGLDEDTHDWSTDRIEVVVQDQTAGGNPMRWSWLLPFDRPIPFREVSSSTKLSFWVRNRFRCRIRAQIHLPKRAIVVLARKEQVESRVFMAQHADAMGYVVLSGVGFNRERTQAIFYVDHFCGLCGGGRYVLMEMRDGRWVIVDEHYTWIS